MRITFYIVFREQEQEEILRARLGRRDSAAQITTISPPTEVSTGNLVGNCVRFTLLISWVIKK